VDKSGSHCFILCSDAVFYANFLSDTVHEVTVTDEEGKKSASKFTCIDMAQASQDDLEVFEVVMGRQDGSIWHGCF